MFSRRGMFGVVAGVLASVGWAYRPRRDVAAEADCVFEQVNQHRRVDDGFHFIAENLHNHPHVIKWEACEQRCEPARFLLATFENGVRLKSTDGRRWFYDRYGREDARWVRDGILWPV